MNSESVDGQPIESSKKSRTIRACQRCRSQKLKCSGTTPCQRCVRLHVICKDGNEVDTKEKDSLPTKTAFSTTEAKLHSALRRIAQLEASVDSINIRFANHQDFSRDSTAAVQSTNLTNTSNHLPSSSTDSQFPAPFTDVAFDKKALENRQETRANSPEDGEDAQDLTYETRPVTQKEGEHPEYGHETSFGQKNGIRKMGTLGSPFERPLDPIKENVISIARAQRLLEFFYKNCLTYVPLFDPHKLPTIEEMRQSDLCLFCSIIAIAARYTAMIDPSFSTEQVEQEREDLCQIVEAHIAKTLIQPRHRLSDVQAIILLHAYGLRSGGFGYDPWILSGHAFRLGKRLSIDRITTLQSASKVLSKTTSLPRRAWLLLCASDCFPSLGFGRPASPRENLESCAPVVNLLADQYAKKSNGVDRGGNGEFFIASQVELAFISRRLMDWVAQTNLSFSRASDLRAIAHKYDMLVDQLDSCQLRWDSAELGDAEQWSASRLFRLHVRLCLATFTMKLGQTAISNGDSKKRKNAEGGTRSVDLVSIDRSQEIANRLQIDCKIACLNSAKEMIEIHKQATLTFLPDYLITALAQAIITSIGILETQQRSGQVSNSEAVSLAQNLVEDAQSTLSKFAANQTDLAQFLVKKVLDRARRSYLLDSYNVSRNLRFMEFGTTRRSAKSFQLDEEQAGTRSMYLHGRPDSGQAFLDSWNPETSNLRAVESSSTNNGTAGYAVPAPQIVQHADANTMTIADIDTWLNTHGTCSDPALQWNGQFWDGDDPLQLLFGVNSDNHLWPSANTHSSDTGDSMRGGSITGGTTTSPF